MSVARQAIREKIIQRLYAGKDIVLSTTTSAGSTSTVVDIQLIRGMFEANDYIGAYVWISSGATADEESSKIIAFDRVTGTFTMSPVYTGISGTSSTYEIHYDLAPARVNEAIVYAVEVGTRKALAMTDATDAGTTTLDSETVIEGALAFCKFAIADQTEARDPATRQSDIDTEELLRQAVIHEANWLRGLSLAGYRPAVVSQRTQEDEQVSTEGE